MADAPALASTYDPQSVEPGASQRWEQGGAFLANPTADPDRPTYCVVIPPPNVTGALHLGHALNNTLQDILVRYHRMRGFDTLWQAGTDHAGIATQAVVERRIRQQEGKSRHDLGREELVRRIWKWKDEYESRIIGQLKLMGCSCDWSRIRFTLDEGLAKAVQRQFLNLFKDGLIFRGKRLVNWDTELQTAVANDEVYHETVKGYFWHFKYPIIEQAAGEPQYVMIATTRPETMLGDTAVAVHPNPQAAMDRAASKLQESLSNASAKEQPAIQQRLDDLEARRGSLLPNLIKLSEMAGAGRRIRLPLVDRDIPLIADEWADPCLGSGCVKITPAHDPNDYEVGLRHNLPMINVLAADGTIAPILEPDGSPNPNSDKYQRLAFSTTGREKVVADLEALGLVEEIEERDREVGHSDRSKAAIEPYLSDQWFVQTGDVVPHADSQTSSVTLADGTRTPGLAQAAIDAVESGRINIFPDRYAKSYLDWLGEKRDWCISRQLWWGHRIPIWSGQRQRDASLSDVLDGLQGRSSFARNGAQQAATDDTTDSPLLICAEASEQDGTTLRGAGFCQDEDVLDTWFSSALWPFSTMGWPEETDHLKRYYPGAVLITSRDIITNWVARMVMFGLYALGDIPFHRVYIHPKILDGRGETMSKTKGNGVDPVDVIHTHGADALRFTMAEMCTETQDIRMPVEYFCPHCRKLTDQPFALKAESQSRKSRGEKLDRKLQPADLTKVACRHCKEDFATQWAPDTLKEELGLARDTSDKFDAGRNFCNKLWNAARFAMMNLDGVSCEKLDIAALPPEDRWILSKLSLTIMNYHEHVGQYLFSASIREVRDFFWDCLCDWYIELTKPRMSGERGDAQRQTAQQVLAFCLDQVLRLLHPTVPFITEHIWQILNQVAPHRGLPGVAEVASEGLLATAQFPPERGYPALEDKATLSVFAQLQDATRGVRELKNSAGVSPKETVDVTVAVPKESLAEFNANAHIVKHMAGIETLVVDPAATRPKNAASTSVQGIRIFVHNISDDDAERSRSEKVLAGIQKQIAGKESKLSNEKFLQNAKPEVVDAEQERLASLVSERDALKSHLAQLG